MKYVGLDLHMKTIAVCVVNQERKVIQRNTLYCIDPPRIRAYFASLGEFEAVVEATASYQWLLDLLEPLGKRIILAHPGKMRIIAESARKSDKLDAQILAEFLAMGWIPEAHQPGKRQRELRRLSRHRVEVARRRAQTQTRIRRLLADSNVVRDRLFNSDGLAMMKTLKLSRSDRFTLDQLLARWKLLVRQEKATLKRLQQEAKRGSAQEKESRKLLETVPGVGPIVANIFLAELGDVKRFSSNKRVSAYVGLAPAKRESAGKSKELGITKEGTPWLRWAMNQSAWQAVRHSIYWKNVFEGLAKRRGRKKAITAIARRLLTVMVAVVRDGKPYDPSQTLKSYHPRKHKPTRMITEKDVTPATEF